MTEKIAGYILEKKIARGGMAEVYLASREGPEGFKKQIAIKRIHEHLTDHAGLKSMFLDEARLVAQLSHPNIVQIFDMGQADDRLFLAMEFIDGLDLSRILRQCEAKGQRLPFEIAAHLAAEVSLGLDYAHEFVDQDGQHLNIIHRDISPQNIMVTHDGVVKIVDFGIAKAASNLYKTKTVSIKGKIQYMSPEQVKGHVAMDRRTDVYSTGVVLYQMLTHHLPHKAPSDITLMKTIVTQPAPDPRKLTPDIPVALARIVNKALQRDRNKRYASSRELSLDLTRFGNQQSSSVDSYALKTLLQGLCQSSGEERNTVPPQENSSTPPNNLLSKRQTTWMLVALALLAFGGGFAIFSTTQNQEPTTRSNPPIRTEADLAKKEVVAQEKKREELLAEFISLWNRSRKLAKDPKSLIQAKRALEKTLEIAEKAGIDEAVQVEVQALLDETKKSIINKKATIKKKKKRKRKKKTPKIIVIQSDDDWQEQKELAEEKNREMAEQVSKGLMKMFSKTE